MNIKVLVATHKKYEMPTDDSLYLPIFVGKTLHPDASLPYTGDNSGVNISEKNTSYNELTALYWAWKNLNADVIGLDHYRRYMSLSKDKSISKVLTRNEIEGLLTNVDIILPKKRNYIIQSNYNHYVHAHHSDPLDETSKIIHDQYPEYFLAFENVMKSKSAHMFNMFIMKKDKFDEYCEWLFNILYLLEDKIDTSEYDAYEKRVYGFVSELLLDVWLETNGYSYKEVNLVHMESQKWLSKGFRFLGRMFVKSRK